MPLADTTDAMGGTGSIPSNLWGIAVGGLSRYIDGRLSREYPLTSMNEQQAVDAYGNQTPRGAPQTPVAASNTASAILSNPLVIGGIVVAVAIIALAFAVRR